MDLIVLLAILAAVLNGLAVQVLLIGHLRKGQEPAPREAVSEEEQEARKLAAEAQARYEQGFVNLMSYDGMPAKKKEGMLG